MSPEKLKQVLKIFTTTIKFPSSNN